MQRATLIPQTDDLPTTYSEDVALAENELCTKTGVVSNRECVGEMQTRKRNEQSCFFASFFFFLFFFLFSKAHDKYPSCRQDAHQIIDESGQSNVRLAKCEILSFHVRATYWVLAAFDEQMNCVARHTYEGMDTNTTQNKARIVP